MTAAFEIGGEEGVDDGESFFGRYESGGEDEDVGIVVLACQASEFGIPAEGGA